MSRKTKMLAVATVLVAGAAGAQQMPEMPQPQKEHEWLKQLVGEWDYDAEMTMEPGKAPMLTSGTEITRPVGGFWTISEATGQVMGAPFKGVMTLGFNPADEKYVGTWVDSMQNRMWQYTGTVDQAGKKLTLDTEGPCPMQAGKILKFQETLSSLDPILKRSLPGFRTRGCGPPS
jgi:hypothetical protein